MNARAARNNTHPGLARLKDIRLLRENAYIAGKWVRNADGRSVEVLDPATGMTVAFVASVGAEETGQAIDAASKALQAWKALLPQDRSAILKRWNDLILANADDLALLMVLEQGKPLDDALGEISYAASFIEFYAEETKRVTVENVTSHLRGAQMRVSREPIGVVGLVTPWNFPSAMLTRKAAAALAAGCTVVAHPSSETPLSGLALAELAERAGFPEGVFNLVTGSAATIVGQMCKDDRVRALSFTGSTEIGRVISAQCAHGMKRLVMELGGHAPLIVFADADLERAVDIAIDAKFATSGQDCLAANRIYVERPILADFADLFARKTSKLVVGNGLDRGVQIGPLMHKRAVAKVEEHVADALEKGARLIAGGSRHAAGPLFYQPTVLVDVPDSAAIMHEETFGPVAAITGFDTESEALSRANDTEYGLVAYLVTKDGARIARMSAELDFGMVAVNRVKITGAPIPFGGRKASGMGREGSRHGLEAFTDLKYVCLDLA